MQTLCVLGSTGSIGQSTLDVIASHPQKYSVFALAANSGVETMLQQCLGFSPQYAVMGDAEAANKLAEALSVHKSPVRVLSGSDELARIAGVDEVDTVVAAIVGAAGLQSTMAAVQAGKKVLLANKEALVMSGHLFTQAAKATGAQILPVDSEHNAIFQCLPPSYSSLEQAGVNKIILTGSGGPFRTLALEEMANVSPDEACAHPNWNMGRKISVDSATMMNKGLELIEACWLFSARPEQIQIVVHPQSIVHSMVEYVDGSVLAQLGRPDMRTPIAHCLAWPQRIRSGVEPLDFYKLASLDFSAPDYERFPCLRLAMGAIEQGGDCPAALNAANEVAVAGFLSGKLLFTDIAQVIEKVMANWRRSEPFTLDDVIKADLTARHQANEAILELEHSRKR